MLIDKEGRKWESVQEWIRMPCNRKCRGCPISSHNNCHSLDCFTYTEEYPQEALARLKNAGVLRDDDEEEEEKIPPLCEVLRVKPEQEFMFEGRMYKITSFGERMVWYEYEAAKKWRWDSSCATLEKMIQNRDKIKIQNGPWLTEEQMEELKKVKKMLPEAKKVYWTEDGMKVRMTSLCDYKLNLGVEMPEGLDWEFEEEEEK